MRESLFASRSFFKSRIFAIIETPRKNPREIAMFAAEVEGIAMEGEEVEGIAEVIADGAVDELVTIAAVVGAPVLEGNVDVAELGAMVLILCRYNKM